MTSPRDIPMLFSGPMVLKLLDGSKTQTRRLNNGPMPRPGDRIWVKETIRRVALGGPGYAVYAADGEPAVVDTWPWKRDVLTAIHMPRGASRITLEIAEVRVQLLQEISEYDARSEGCDPVVWERKVYPSGRAATVETPSYRDGFGVLWDSINSKRAPWSSNPRVRAITFRRLP